MVFRLLLAVQSPGTLLPSGNSVVLRSQRGRGGRAQPPRTLHAFTSAGAAMLRLARQSLHIDRRSFDQQELLPEKIAAGGKNTSEVESSLAFTPVCRTAGVA